MKKFYGLVMLLMAMGTWANQPKDIIPFEIVNGHIRVEIIVNDVPLNVVFDTGASTNLLSDEAAERLQLDLGGRTNIQGAAGSSNMKLARGESFVFGKTQFKNQNFAVMDISHLGEEGNPIDGVFGASILTQYIVEMDYDNQEIRLYNSLDGLDLDEYAKYEYSLTPFRIPIIESILELDNGTQIRGKYFVDTGAALGIMFNSNLVKAYDLLETMGENYPITSTSLSSSDTDYVSAVPKFTLFDHTFEDFAVRLSQASQGVNSFEGYHGIIGFDLLKRYNTIFDYAHEHMYVRPNDSFDDPFPRNYTGLQVEKTNGNYRVINVAKNSAGELALIKRGDLIKKIDGKTFNSKSAFNRYFQEANSEVFVDLIRNGEELKLKMTPRPTIN